MIAHWTRRQSPDRRCRWQFPGPAASPRSRQVAMINRINPLPYEHCGNELNSNGNPVEGAPDGLATRVSTPCRVRSSLRRTRDRGASVSTRGLTLTRVTPSSYVRPSSAATDADSVVRSTTPTPPFHSKKLSFLSLMALNSPAKRGSLSTQVDRPQTPRKEKPVELNIVNEVATLERLSIARPARQDA
jgi:hypothetical protein